MTTTDVAADTPEAPQALQKALRRHARRLDVDVVWTRNRSTLVSSRVDPDGSAVLRLHRAFRAADAETLEAVVRLHLGRPRRANRPALRQRLYAFLHETGVGMDSADHVRDRLLPPQGEHHDLGPLLRRAARTYLGRPARELVERVGWSTRPLRREMARWFPAGDRPGIVRVNRLLDDRRVPDWYLEYLAFHELLHAELGVEVVNGRRCAHTPEFRRRERSFLWLPEVQRVEEVLVPRLVREAGL